MEEFQRNIIQKNLVFLIKNTICSTTLIARLISENVLNPDDVELLKSLEKSKYQQAKQLYEILQTRKNGFKVIFSALEETQQSGAYEILNGREQEFRQYGLIEVYKGEVLGTGSLGTVVYKGKFHCRDVAVKALNSVIVDKVVAKREVEFLRTLDDHENIVRYHFSEEYDNFIYIAMEPCQINLEDEVRINLVNMKPMEVLRKCTQGLEYLHDRNIIHGDLKPANILLNRPNRLKISDFGLSKQIPNGANSVTVAGMPGTTEWMAPEILEIVLKNRNEPQNGNVKMTKSSDIFSLGCIFYYVLSEGSHLFGEPGDREYYIRRNKPQYYNNSVSPGWLTLVLQMIVQSHQYRPSAKTILIYIDQNPEQIDVHSYDMVRFRETVFASEFNLLDIFAAEPPPTSQVGNDFSFDSEIEPDIFTNVITIDPTLIQTMLQEYKSVLHKPLHVVVDSLPRNILVHPMKNGKYGLFGGDKGLALLVNIKCFDKTWVDKYQWVERGGSEFDIIHMRKLWSELGYQIYEPHFIDEKRGKWYKKDLLELIANFHRQCNQARPKSVVVFIGSHGIDNTIVTSDYPLVKYASSHAVFSEFTAVVRMGVFLKHKKFEYTPVGINLVRDVVSKFSDSNCPGLKGKPKIFLVSAYQPFELYLNQSEFRDIIVCTAHVPEYPLCRAQSGTWLIHCLTFVMMKSSREKSFQEILKIVRKMMKKLKEQNGSLLDHSEIPVINSFGMHDLFFHMFPETNIATKSLCY